MKICNIQSNNWCKEHKMFHHGRERELSQMEDELGEKYRKLWTEIKDNPEKFKPEKVDYSNCGKNTTQNQNQKQKRNNGPNLFKRIVGFIKELWKHIKNGLKKVEQTEQERRLGICARCPHRMPKTDKKEDWQCLVCGCNLLKKTSWDSSACPLGYWEKIQNTTQTGGCGCKG